MTAPMSLRAKYVLGPDGCPLTIADLPAPGTKRWVIRRKAQIVASVRGGLLSLEEACKRYTLTVEEFLSWQYSIDRHGLAGLRTTRIQQYRQKRSGATQAPPIQAPGSASLRVSPTSRDLKFVNAASLPAEAEFREKNARADRGLGP